ncbi:C4-dicarboxylate ABC transporter [Agreia sp. Leaf244]|jgi:C4-dicarboxylate transporter/malic acid transport protein|uniref:C4-dicarboxylate ABC transporter n=2 Tax=Microbacteriaceae TaxID=85023 RepID=A0A1B1BQN0_9MICO|nr:MULTISPECIES: TDT family transporter [Microbacteriaceae]ANP74791.1 C4-dicarboxylate ABC transporter [Cryobacterium arcticum]KQO09893.1 C4-dicarboxylate ABC transporter [Agreia sp. Leaf244]SMG23551.1 C4-dicarboxylate transporter/malic acid transport protein [Agreia pratensis]
MSTAQAVRPATPSRMLMRELEHPMHMFRNITPNWYASVMGTGIVANAAATLPLQFAGLRAAATVVWVIASVLLVALTAATVMHWVTNRETARTHHLNPVMAHFYGAPAMALLTVGAGTILLGRDVLGEQTAVAIDAVLWALGTIMGLATAVAVPYLTFTKFTVSADSAFGGWLMPIVPPMVSASTGALLIPYLPEGQARLTMLLACYGMFGLSLLASLIVITLIWSRLTTHKIGAAAMVPTLWIVLGPLGQSVTAVNLLGGNAHLATTTSLADALQAFGVIYGVPVLGFAALWAALALAITVRTAREHLPFSLTWWSFTFPVGTCVTGLTGVALHTGSVAFQVAAVFAFAALLTAWAVVAVRTFHGSALTGVLFMPPAAKTV